MIDAAPQEADEGVGETRDATPAIVDPLPVGATKPALVHELPQVGTCPHGAIRHGVDERGANAPIRCPARAP